jgi:putative endonuclease
MPAYKDRVKAYRLGIMAEYLAAAFLILKRYRILNRRYRCREGEIDIIARKGDNIVFIEVKIRKSADDALEAVRPASQRRISRAALHYMSAFGKPEGFSQRFDVIAVSPPLIIKHIKNAWFAAI